MEFLGHVFDAEGIRLSDARIQGIQSLPLPTSVTVVRSFIGMVNYFRDFIPHLADHLGPLYALTSQRQTSTNFRMSADAQKAFKNVKELLNQATKLVIMNERDQLV